MPDWLEFEKAVAAFLQALDPTANVQHNAKVSDRDTGRLRQRDVWIETSYGGHIRFAILVSCKRYARKVNIQDLDAFIGELSGSGAAVGVLFSYSGFTEPALEKARTLRISCCSLLENSSALPPGVVAFDVYFYRARLQMSYRATEALHVDEIIRLMQLRFRRDGGTVDIIDELSKHYTSYLDMGLAKNAGYIFEQNGELSVSLTLPSGGRFTAYLTVSWDVFKASREAFLVSGSYNLTEGTFIGELTGPAVDAETARPEGEWQHLPWPLPPFEGGPSPISVVAMSGDLRKTIIDGFAELKALGLP